MTGAAALRYMLGASALVAGTSVLAKTLGMPIQGQTGLHPLIVSAGRFVFAFVALLVALPALKPATLKLQDAPYGVHLARSVCGWLGVTCMFAAVSAMPLADATAVSFLSPIVTLGLASVFLGERLGRRKAMAAASALLGAVCILRPGTEAFQPAGFFALAAAVFMGAEATLIKRLSDTEPALRILFINNAIGAIVSALAASTVWIWPNASQLLLLIALGVTMVSAQTLFIQAMKRSEAGPVMLVFYSVLIFATLYDLILFGVLPGWISVIGAALILASAVIVSQRRTQSH